jgi:hypothetical protein
MKKLMILLMSCLALFSASCRGLSVGLSAPYPGYGYDEGYWGGWDDGDDEDFGDEDFGGGDFDEGEGDEDFDEGDRD